MCPIYVALVIDDSEHWGVRLRTASRKGRENKLQRCDAPDSWVCFHKGVLEPNNKRRCYSSDGFTTQVPEDMKLKLVTQGGEVVDAELNEQELCPHIASYRRPPTKKSGNRARRRGGGGKSGGTVLNQMPGGDDPRKQAVYSELWGRVGYLQEHNLPVKAETIAAMAGHAAWKNRDVHVA